MVKWGFESRGCRQVVGAAHHHQSPRGDVETRLHDVIEFSAVAVRLAAQKIHADRDTNVDLSPDDQCIVGDTESVE